MNRAKSMRKIANKTNASTFERYKQDYIAEYYSIIETVKALAQRGEYSYNHIWKDKVWQGDNKNINKELVQMVVYMLQNDGFEVYSINPYTGICVGWK